MGVGINGSDIDVRYVIKRLAEVRYQAEYSDGACQRAAVREYVVTVSGNPVASRCRIVPERGYHRLFFGEKLYFIPDFLGGQYAASRRIDPEYDSLYTFVLSHFGNDAGKAVSGHLLDVISVKYVPVGVDYRYGIVSPVVRGDFHTGVVRKGDHGGLFEAGGV